MYIGGFVYSCLSCVVLVMYVCSYMELWRCWLDGQASREAHIYAFCFLHSCFQPHAESEAFVKDEDRWWQDLVATCPAR